MDDDKKNQVFQLNIFGSCVSRDVLEVQKERKIFLKSYIARQSIVSAVSEPISIDADKLKLNSEFQKRMVLHDFKKDTFEVFRKNNSDYILIDFIDERFPLVKIGHSYVTGSNELLTSCYINVPEIVKPHKLNYLLAWLGGRKADKWKIEKTDLEKFIFMFTHRLLDIYQPKQIIVHEVYLSDIYRNIENEICLFPKNHLANNCVMNEKYEYIYRKFEEFIPNAYIINCSKNYIADENHKWGLSPMHFQKEYYEKVLEEINEIIKK